MSILLHGAKLSRQILQDISHRLCNLFQKKALFCKIVWSPRLLPQLAKKCTRLYPSYPWHFATLLSVLPKGRSLTGKGKWTLDISSWLPLPPSKSISKDCFLVAIPQKIICWASVCERERERERESEVSLLLAGGRRNRWLASCQHPPRQAPLHSLHPGPPDPHPPDPPNSLLQSLTQNCD